MNELSARAKLELEKQRLSVTHNLAWLEQALLAERKSVWEEAAKMAEAMAEPCIDPTSCFDASHRKARKLAQALRAAAEKEVGKR